MIVEGLLLGVVYVLPPGPVTIETVRRGLQGGIHAALAVQLGAVGGRLLYAILVLASLSNVLTHTAVRGGVGLLGAVLLLWLGVSALRSQSPVASPELNASGHLAGASVSLWRQARVGLIVSVLNPLAAGFWLTVGSTGMAFAPSWLAGFWLGSLLASLLTGVVAGQLHGPGTARYAHWVSLGCGCVLIACGLRLGWAMLSLLWPLPSIYTLP